MEQRHINCEDFNCFCYFSSLQKLFDVSSANKITEIAL